MTLVGFCTRYHLEIAGVLPALFLTLLALSPGAMPASIVVETELVTAGLDDPLALVHSRDGTGRLFIVEQGGKVKIYNDGVLLATPFLDIPGKVACCGERGLLGLAFHPNYEVNGRFFVSHTDLAGNSVLARYLVSSDPNVADPASEQIMLTVVQPFSNHNGGNIAFGPDGYLYYGMGDGGSGGDPQGNGQNLQTLLGKLLRLDVDNPPTFIPADNPYVGDPQGLDPIWASGLRNPWRFSFDRLTGDLYVGDVGQRQIEEVSVQPAGSPGGENYGWKVLEGSRCFSDAPAGACTDFQSGGSVLPIIEYGHSAENCSITGGFRYRGSMFPSLEGIYFFADFCTGRIWGATEDAPDVWSFEELLDTPLLISSFGEDEEGELYVTHHSSSGEVYRLVARIAPDAIKFLGGFQAIETVPNNTTEDAYVVPPGVNALVTDLIISNPNANAACCAEILGDDEARAGPISISAEDTVTINFITGIGFNPGTVIRLRNSGNAGPLHFTVRGYRYTLQ